MKHGNDRLFSFGKSLFKGMAVKSTLSHQTQRRLDKILTNPIRFFFLFALAYLFIDSEELITKSVEKWLLGISIGVGVYIVVLNWIAIFDTLQPYSNQNRLFRFFLFDIILVCTLIHYSSLYFAYHHDFGIQGLDGNPFWLALPLINIRSILAFGRSHYLFATMLFYLLSQLLYFIIIGLNGSILLQMPSLLVFLTINGFLFAAGFLWIHPRHRLEGQEILPKHLEPEESPSFTPKNNSIKGSSQGSNIQAEASTVSPISKHSNLPLSYTGQPEVHAQGMMVRWMDSFDLPVVRFDTESGKIMYSNSIAQKRYHLTHGTFLHDYLKELGIRSSTASVQNHFQKQPHQIYTLQNGQPTPHQVKLIALHAESITALDPVENDPKKELESFSNRSTWYGIVDVSVQETIKKELEKKISIQKVMYKVYRAFHNEFQRLIQSTWLQKIQKLDLTKVDDANQIKHDLMLYLQQIADDTLLSEPTIQGFIEKVFYCIQPYAQTKDISVQSNLRHNISFSNSLPFREIFLPLIFHFIVHLIDRLPSNSQLTLDYQPTHKNNGICYVYTINNQEGRKAFVWDDGNHPNEKDPMAVIQSKVFSQFYIHTEFIQQPTGGKIVWYFPQQVMTRGIG